MEKRPIHYNIAGRFALLVILFAIEVPVMLVCEYYIFPTFHLFGR